MTKPHNVHWDNIGITTGVITYELCDICKKDCSSKIIRSRTEKEYIIKCSQFEHIFEHIIDEEFIAKHRD